MKTITLLIVCIAAALGSFSQAPTINAFPVGSANVAPYSGATGTTMTISGTNFAGASAVSFGGTSASSFTVVSATTITAVVGGGSTGIVSVTTPAGTATRAGFTYLPLSRIITDFGGYWSTTTALSNGTVPDSSHNLLGFKYNNTIYSTGANDALLTARGVSFSGGNYRAFPVAGITGSNPSSSSIYLAMASKTDGNPATGSLAGVASSTIRSVMIDGIQGLDLGTGVTNLPTSAVMTFNLNSINVSTISDAEPDILITQIADPSVGNDVFQFVDASGTIVGNSITQDMTVLTSLGNYKLDLFGFTAGTAYNVANPTNVNSSNTLRGIRMVAFKLSDFGVTAGNFATIKAFKIIPSGNSDYAFIAYNANAISSAPDIAQNGAVTISSVCSTGTALLSVTASASAGGALSYFWERSMDGGTIWSAVTDGGNFSGATTINLTISNPVNNDKYRATVSEAGGGTNNTSAPFTLTVAAPTVAGTLNGGTTVCNGINTTDLTLTGQTGSIVRWESSTNNFNTLTTYSNTTNSLTATNLSTTTQYRAVVQSGACTSVSTTATTINVIPLSAGGLIAGATAVCSGTNSTTLTLNSQVGNILRWESSVNNFISIVNIANTTTSLTATNLTATTQYRAVVQSGSCTISSSSTTTITYNAVGQWIGGPAGNWNVVSNWCGGLPTSLTNVQIPATATVTLSYGNAFANTVTIASGGNLSMTDTANLIISGGGSFSNNGTFDASGCTTGKVSFSGNGSINGTSTFQNIETFGTLDFGTASTIAKEFTLQPGSSVTVNPPTYLCPAATLIYNTGGIFSRSLEWPSVSTGKGFPSNVSVKNSTAINFPVAGAGYICNDLIIEHGSALYQNYSGASASLNVGRHVIINGTLSLGSSAGGDITLAGNWTRNTGGIFNDNTRMVTFAGTLHSIISAPAATIRDAHGAFGGETFYTINISKATAAGDVELASNISVINELKITQGIFALANSDVTIVSDIVNTAHIAPIPPSGAIIRYGGTGGTGTGKFIIQRHLSIGSGSVSRRWRFLSAPLNSTGAPTLNEAWQSGVSNSDRNAPVDPWPGFGTTITKSTVYNAADGYDAGSTNNASMYYINAGAWGILPSTKVPITDHEAYMLFVRGSRSIVVSTPLINANTTILESKGRINIGDIQKPVVAGYNAIGNPYASSLSFNTLVFNNYTTGGTHFDNVTPGSPAGTGLTYYLWDPKTSGSSNVGKWITCSSNGNGTYSVTANSSGLPTDGTIQSGTAFMVSAELPGGVIIFHEADKSCSGSSIGIASRNVGVTGTVSSLATTLLAGKGPTALISEGVINSYHSAYHNEVDGQDAPAASSFNTADALSIRSQGKYLSIERRNKIAENDTIFLQIQNLRNKAYSFQFKPVNINPAITAFLEDNFKGTSRPVSMIDTSTINFEINDSAGSSAADRFRIVFKKRKLAIAQSSIEAIQQNKNIAVQWTLENDHGINKSELEKSADGKLFTKVTTVEATSVTGAALTNNWLDMNGLKGDNFYRIKNTLLNGTIEYSKVARVALNNKPAIAVYPNPVTDGLIKLQFSNMLPGNYKIVITNRLGQLVHNSTIHYSGENTFQIRPSEDLTNGNYNLEVSGNGHDKQAIKLLIQAHK